MAKCFDVVGYVEPCNAVRQKYTGRGLLITGKNLQPTFLGSGIKVEELDADSMFIDAAQGEQGFVPTWTKSGGKALPIMIDAQNPFGVTVQGNTDSGRVMYTKTIPVTIPATRDGKAEEFIMGLQKGLYDSSAIVLETFGNIDENDIFGIYSPLRLDPASVTRNEYENGSAWTFNLVCEEPVPNVICTLTDLTRALDKLNV